MPNSEPILSAALAVLHFGVLVAAAASAPAAAMPTSDVDEINLVRSVNRSDGAAPSDAYQFENCVRGSGITGVLVTTPLGSPGVPDQTLMPDGPGEFCFSQTFASAGDIEAAFPSGVYTYEIESTGGSDSVTLAYTASEPLAFADFSAPVDGSLVSDSVDLTIVWSLSEKSPCIASDTCADGLMLQVEDNFNNQLLNTSPLLTDTSVTVPASSLSAGVDLSILAIVFDGVFGSGLTTSGDGFTSVVAYGELNEISATTTAATTDIQELRVIKVHERSAGIPLASEPFYAEVCARGSTINAASVVSPSAQPGPPDLMLSLVDGSNDEFCQTVRFADLSSLEAAYPNGDYTFSINGPGPVDTKTLSVAGALPRAFLGITSPLDGDTSIDSAIDLPVQWSLVETTSCAVSMSCGSGGFVQARDVAADQGLLDLMVPLAGGSASIPATDLSAGTPYEVSTIAADAFFGSDVTDLGDDIDVITGYAEFDSVDVMTVPELGADSSALVALALLAGSRLRRGN